MCTKQKLIYMGVGSLLTLAGFLLASIVQDVAAQEKLKDGKFDTLTCRNLYVEGKVMVWGRFNRATILEPGVITITHAANTAIESFLEMPQPEPKKHWALGYEGPKCEIFANQIVLAGEDSRHAMIKLDEMGASVSIRSNDGNGKAGLYAFDGIDGASGTLSLSNAKQTIEIAADGQTKAFRKQ